MTDGRTGGPANSSGGAPPWQRRVFHLIAGSGVAAMGLVLPDFYPATAAGLLAGGALSLDLTRFRVNYFNRFFLKWCRVLLKHDEARRLTGATYLLIAAFISFLLFDPAVAVAVLFFLALGDPAAALVGSLMPGPRIFGKSPLGTLAFFIVSLAVIGVLVFSGGTGFRWMLVAGAAVAALVELTPLPVDDNLTVPLTAGAVIQYFPVLFSAAG